MSKFSSCKLFLACLLSLQATVLPAFSEEPAVTSEEALFVRRISEFWKEKDYAAVKTQISDFLNKHGKSALNDQLNAMLGDLYFQETNYEKALASYEGIESVTFQAKVFRQRVHALFKLHRYREVADLSTFYLRQEEEDTQKQNELRFLCAESLFKLARMSQDEKERQALAKEAKNHYLILEETAFSDACLFPLAETSKMLQDAPEAASLYLYLAEKHPAQAEGLLYHAAYMQASFDKGAAAQTFEKVRQLGGKQASEAAYNELTLLFETEQYREFLLHAKQCKQLVPADKSALMQFYEGRSHYALGAYAEAITPLETALSSTELSATQKKIALLSLMVCAQKREDLALGDLALSKIFGAFPEDGEFCKALLMHSQMCLSKGESSKAEEDLKQILERFPNYNGKETVLFDYGVLLSQQQRWEESHLVFSSFLTEFSSSAFSSDAWRHLLAASTSLVKQKSEIEQRRVFAQDLKGALSQKGAFTTEEREELHFLLIKTLSDLKQNEEAIKELDLYVGYYPQGKHIAEAHALLGLYHQNAGATSEIFILHTEKALSLNPDLPNREVLYLQLFNAYLKLAEAEEHPIALFDKAADNLYKSWSLNPEKIKLENKLWLVDYYYNKAEKSDARIFGDRALLVAEQMLGSCDQEKPKLNITAETLFLEGEALKCAQLFAWQNQHQRQAALLEALRELQDKEPQLCWRFKRQTLFELAKAYEAAGDKQKALATYDTLINTSSHVSSYLSSAALLEKVRLQYSLLNETQRTLTSNEIMEILSNLKDLQIKKRLHSEPIHLEAALDYVKIKCALIPSDKSQALFLLKRVKENFMQHDDVLSNDYHKARELFPEQSEIFERYMQYIDAEISRLEAIAAKESGDENAPLLQENAHRQLLELMQQPLPSTLLPRVRESLEAQW